MSREFYKVKIVIRDGEKTDRYNCTAFDKSDNRFGLMDIELSCCNKKEDIDVFLSINGPYKKQK